MSLAAAFAIALTLGGCGKKSPTQPPPDSVKIPATTRVLGDSTQQLLLSPPGGDTLLFSRAATQAAALKPNDVIVGTLGHGFLRRVTSVEVTPSSYRVLTTAAALNEAIESGDIAFKRTLTASQVTRVIRSAKGVTVHLSPSAEGDICMGIERTVLFDRDGDRGTGFDQVTADGQVCLRPDLEFSASIRSFQLQGLTVKMTANQSASLTVTAEIGVGLAEELELACIELSPIVVMVGPVPVVFTPQICLILGLDGSVSAQLLAGIEATSSYTAGLTYASGRWSPIRAHENTFTAIPPHFTVGCEAKGYAGPKASLLLYGVAGAYVQTDAFLRWKADLTATPWWVLSGGLEAGAGVELRVFSRSLANYGDSQLISFSRVIAEASGAPTGMIGGVVRDAVTSLPLVGVVVEATRAGFSRAVTSDASGIYSLVLPVASDYTIRFAKTGYLPVSYYGVQAHLGLETPLETVLQIDAASAGLGTLGGLMVSALDGSPIGGVTVALRRGLNNQTGAIAYSTMTNASGSWSLSNVEAGNYTVEGARSGWLPVWVTGLCLGNASSVTPDGVMTPILPQGEVRVVLSWGLSPSDLDSHLTGPAPDGTRFHLYYPYADDRGTNPWPSQHRLDRDDVTSFGPETVTILQQLPGAYRYLVHDFSNRASTFSTELGNSGAQVRVYGSAGLLAAFNVPAGREGTLWTVFEMDGGVITRVNAMSYEQASGGVRLTGPADVKLPETSAPGR